MSCNSCVMHHLYYLLFIILLSYCSSSSSSSSSSSREKECDLYMAQSSIPNAGMGLFIGQDISKNSLVLESQPDIIVPIFDVEDIEHLMIKKYTWQGYTYGLQSEANWVEGYAPGLFSLVNGHQGLSNIAVADSVKKDWSDVSRNNSAAGSFTPYHNLQAVALEDLKKGTELFVSYGDHWYTFGKRADLFGNVPLSYDYEEASEFIKRFHRFYHSNIDRIEKEEFDVFWEYARDNSMTSTNAKSLLPETVEDVLVAHEMKVNYFNAPKEFIRDINWLQHNGLCVSNLYPQKSTIPNAGRGAFSKKAFEIGDVVTSSPLMHECDSTYMDMEVPNNGGWRTQLLYNYCLQNPHSSLTFYPYGPHVNLINHDATNPNVKIQFSSRFTNPNWLLHTIEDLCEETHVEFVIDYIAIRHINEKEEILMDYGMEWQNAWNIHVEQYQNTDDVDYKSSEEFNQNHHVIMTMQEQYTTSSFYPSNIITECFYDPNYVESTETDYLQYYDYKLPENTPVQQHKGHTAMHDLNQCTIYSRITVNSKHYYLVGMYLWSDGENQDDFETIVYDIPRDKIRFNDDAYTSIIHSPDAFRHYIGFSNDVFPKQWMDLLQS